MLLQAEHFQDAFDKDAPHGIRNVCFVFFLLPGHIKDDHDDNGDNGEAHFLHLFRVTSISIAPRLTLAASQNNYVDITEDRHQ